MQTLEPKTKVPLVQAETMAEYIKPILAPLCERIEIVGSLRRRLATGSPEPVGDIEFLAIPKCIPGESTLNLFGEETTEEIDLLHEFLTNKAGEAEEWFPRQNLKGSVSSMGRSIKHLHFHRVGLQPIKVDIFTCTAQQYGVLQLVRTGPFGFSRGLVMQSKYGGLCPEGFSFKNWRVSDDQGNPTHETPTEESVFHAIKHPFMDIPAREQYAKEHPFT